MYTLYSPCVLNVQVTLEEMKFCPQEGWLWKPCYTRLIGTVNIFTFFHGHVDESVLLILFYWSLWLGCSSKSTKILIRLPASACLPQCCWVWCCFVLSDSVWSKYKPYKCIQMITYRWSQPNSSAEEQSSSKSDTQSWSTCNQVPS